MYCFGYFLFGCRENREKNDGISHFCYLMCYDMFYCLIFANLVDCCVVDSSIEYRCRIYGW